MMNPKKMLTFKFKEKNFNKQKLKSPKLKEFKVPTWDGTLGRKTKLNNLNNLSSGRSNVFDKVKSVNMDKLRNTMRDSGRVGLWSAKRHKGLTPWKDYDGDGKLNIIDSDPRDRTRQQRTPMAYPGALDETPNPSGDTSGLESLVVEDTGAEPVSETPVSPETNTVENQGRLAAGLAAAGRGLRETFITGREPTPEERERMQRQRDLEDRARRRAEQLREKREIERRARQLSRSSDVPEKSPGRQALSQIGGSFGTIGATSTGLGRGMGVNPAMLRQHTQFMSGPERIALFTGRSNPQHLQEVSQLRSTPQQFSAPVQPHPQPNEVAQVRTSLQEAPQPQQPPRQERQQSSRREVQQDPQTGVWSPHSKRKVSYVRGPYKSDDSSESSE